MELSEQMRQKFERAREKAETLSIDQLKIVCDSLINCLLKSDEKCNSVGQIFDNRHL